MSAALHLAGRFKVALVTKRELLDGASSWAQGGIAAVLDPLDNDRYPRARWTTVRDVLAQDRRT